MTGLADLASMQQATLKRVVQRAVDRGVVRAGLDVPLVAVSALFQTDIGA